MRGTRRASCIVSVDAPDTTRRCARSDARRAPADGEEVDAGWRVEAPVLGGEHRVDDVVADLVEADPPRARRVVGRGPRGAAAVAVEEAHRRGVPASSSSGGSGVSAAATKSAMTPSAGTSDEQRRCADQPRDAPRIEPREAVHGAFTSNVRRRRSARRSPARTCTRRASGGTTNVPRRRRAREVAVVVHARGHVLDEGEHAVVVDLAVVPGSLVASPAARASSSLVVRVVLVRRRPRPVTSRERAVVVEVRVDRLEPRGQRDRR